MMEYLLAATAKLSPEAVRPEGFETTTTRESALAND